MFLTLKKMGFEQAERCEHVPYGMVELPDGPMSTRKGNIILFQTLRETMTRDVTANYLEKYRGAWPDDEIELVARQITLGAIKYGMLARDVNQIVFDMEQWLQLEGNTGPYLQYVCARAALDRPQVCRGRKDPAVSSGAGPAAIEPHAPHWKNRGEGAHPRP